MLPNIYPVRSRVGSTLWAAECDERPSSSGNEKIGGEVTDEGLGNTVSNELCEATGAIAQDQNALRAR
jgi:hypothetical protein